MFLMFLCYALRAHVRCKRFTNTLLHYITVWNCFVLLFLMTLWRVISLYLRLLLKCSSVFM